ncbi:MAG: HAMP domain-containing histidine kinase [Clostridiales bacterium]|nr:HAMP domain-containing histidine kinase [Clostridiales bacterium]
MITSYIVSTVLAILTILPIISFSLKGIIGLVLMVVTSAKFGAKIGLLVSSFTVLIQCIFFTFRINVDFDNAHTLLVTNFIIYPIISFYLGKFSESVENTKKELKLLREKNENLNRELKRKEESFKSNFLLNISHELRTPLNVILTATQLLEIYFQKGNNRDKALKHINKIKINCSKLIRYIYNIIDVNEIEANVFKVKLRNRDIVNIVEDITLTASEYTNSIGIDLVFETDLKEKIIAIDDVLVERILLNLLSNAVKFTEKGGSIIVKVFSDEENVNISVKDTGRGIPEEEQGEIFKRFTQYEPIMTKDYEGIGVGLYLVKRFVELNEGTITFISHPGEGTSFTISLPDRIIKEDEKNKDVPFVKEDRVERIRLELADILNNKAI